MSAININSISFDEISGDISSPIEGELWYNTNLNRLRLRRDGVDQTLVDYQDLIAVSGTPTFQEIYDDNGAGDQTLTIASGGSLTFADSDNDMIVINDGGDLDLIPGVANGTVNIGSATTSGNLVIYGNLLVQGDQTVIGSTTVTTADNVILINSGEVGNGVTADIAGLQVDRGTGSGVAILWDETQTSSLIDESGISSVGRWTVQYPEGTTRTLATEGWVDRNFINSSEILVISGDLQSQITTNAGNISTNAGNISTNAGNISTNAGNISTNAGNISTNAGNISTNAGNISANTTLISTASGDIVAQIPTVLNDLSDVNTAGVVSGQIIEYNGTSWVVVNNTGGGGGETNTASNIGSGVGVFDTKSGVDLQFNSLSGSPRLSVADSGTEIDFDVVEGALDIRNMGGTSIVSGDIVSQIPDVSNFVTDAELIAASGEIVSQIPTPLVTKAGSITGASFTGNPKIGAVTFSTNFSDTNFSVGIISERNASWTVQNITTGGFNINANSNQAFSETVYWTAIAHGESS